VRTYIGNGSIDRRPSAVFRFPIALSRKLGTHALNELARRHLRVKIVLNHHCGYFVARSHTFDFDYRQVVWEFGYQLRNTAYNLRTTPCTQAAQGQLNGHGALSFQALNDYRMCQRVEGIKAISSK
jgi:hypothetical protein